MAVHRAVMFVAGAVVSVGAWPHAQVNAPAQLQRGAETSVHANSQYRMRRFRRNILTDTKRRLLTKLLGTSCVDLGRDGTRADTPDRAFL